MIWVIPPAPLKQASIVAAIHRFSLLQTNSAIPLTTATPSTTASCPRPAPAPAPPLLAGQARRQKRCFHFSAAGGARLTHCHGLWRGAAEPTVPAHAARTFTRAAVEWPDHFRFPQGGVGLRLR